MSSSVPTLWGPHAESVTGPALTVWTGWHLSPPPGKGKLLCPPCNVAYGGRTLKMSLCLVYTGSSGRGGFQSPAANHSCLMSVQGGWRMGPRRGRWNPTGRTPRGCLCHFIQTPLLIFLPLDLPMPTPPQYGGACLPSLRP